MDVKLDLERENYRKLNMAGEEAAPKRRKGEAGPVYPFPVTVSRFFSLPSSSKLELYPIPIKELLVQLPDW